VQKIKTKPKNKLKLKIMKKILLLLTLIPVLGTPLWAENNPPISKPNIIFILADDLGIGSVSCYGADHFKTPNIDKLAASGVRFSHCYASPLCGPSRALLLTGRYAFRTGMTSNNTGDRLKPANEILIPTILKQGGYVTAEVGKWSQLPLQPGDWGFDEYLRFKGSGIYWNSQKAGKTYTVNGKEIPLRDGEYLPDLMHAFAVDFIKRHKDQPFFLYYPMSHVHAEILPTPDSSAENKKLKRGSIPLYQDNVAYMDKLVGKLMDELDQLKLREKTIVIFTSDNGTAFGEVVKEFDYPAFCTIGGKRLSGHKDTMLEGGALVPMMISWPGTTPAGQVATNLISFADFFPTLAELAGAKLPPGVTIDGRPFTPMFYGQTQGDWLRQWIFVMLRNNWYDRELDWKLDQSGKLFNMMGAPFAEPLVPANPENTEAAAARQRLQAVLNQLNPAAGKPGLGLPKNGSQPKKGKKKTAEEIENASENANAPDQ
jgi:arylsulfatase A